MARAAHSFAKSANEWGTQNPELTWATRQARPQVLIGRSRIPHGAGCSHRRIMVAVVAESMVGGTSFHRRVIQREISRVLVLNLSGKPTGAIAPARRTIPLTEPSLLSRASPPDNGSATHSPPAARSRTPGIEPPSPSRPDWPPPRTAPAVLVRPSSSKAFVSLPRSLRSRGSVRDVLGHPVKDVMGLNTKCANEWGTQHERTKFTRRLGADTVI